MSLVVLDLIRSEKLLRGCSRCTPQYAASKGVLTEGWEAGKRLIPVLEEGGAVEEVFVKEAAVEC